MSWLHVVFFFLIRTILQPFLQNIMRAIEMVKENYRCDLLLPVGNRVEVQVCCKAALLKHYSRASPDL